LALSDVGTTDEFTQGGERGRGGKRHCRWGAQRQKKNLNGAHIFDASMRRSTGKGQIGRNPMKRVEAFAKKEGRGLRTRTKRGDRK